MIDLEPFLRLHDDPWVVEHVHAMGSLGEIVALDATDDAMAWAAGELERLEQCWSRFRDDSELQLLNARAGHWTDVSASMLLALSCAADLHAATCGRFDPTIADALVAAGYDRSFEQLVSVSPTPLPRAPRVPRFVHVELDLDGSRVRVPRGTHLDLGGIGKGLAADLVARGLVDRGARGALVGLGGDLRARGAAPDGGWRIPVEHPFDDARVAFHWPLADGAIVTSTTRLRTWTRAGVRAHHLIDPDTGSSTDSGVAAVVAAARDAWWAEGVAKAIVVAGAYAGAALARDTDVRAWIFLDDGSVLDAGNRD